MSGLATDASGRIFDVLLSVTSQKTFRVAAANADESRAKIERCWTAGEGGRIAHGDMDAVDVQIDVLETR